MATIYGMMDKMDCEILYRETKKNFLQGCGNILRTIRNGITGSVHIPIVKKKE